MRNDAPEASADQARVDEATRKLAEFFRIQGAAVTALAADRTGRKASVDRVFNTAAWNRILAADLVEIARRVSGDAGRATMTRLGRTDGDYDVARTVAWLRAHASGVAAGINAATRAHVADALRQADPAAALRRLFDGYTGGRATQAARTEVTAASGFGTAEAGRQTGQDLSKTWTAGANPRAAHAALSGQTVPLGELFSNGARWPGDSLLPDEERSGCNCSMDVHPAEGVPTP